MMRGFTLIELIITVTVGAILIMLAVPSMGQMIANNRLAGGANEILGAINYARSEAIKRGASVSVCEGDGGWASYTVADGDGNALRVGNGSALSIIGNAECAVFGSVGNLETAALDISICDTGTHQGRKIGLNPVGRAHVESGSC